MTSPESIVLSTAIGFGFGAAFLFSAFKLVRGAVYDLTIDWKSLQWGSNRRSAERSVLNISDLYEAIFWFDDGWHLWLEARSGDRIRVPMVFEAEAYRQICETLRLRGVVVRESESAFGRRPE